MYCPTGFLVVIELLQIKGYLIKEILHFRNFTLGKFSFCKKRSKLNTVDEGNQLKNSLESK